MASANLNEEWSFRRHFRVGGGSAEAAGSELIAPGVAKHALPALFLLLHRVENMWRRCFKKRGLPEAGPRVEEDEESGGEPSGGSTVGAEAEDSVSLAALILLALWKYYLQTRQNQPTRDESASKRGGFYRESHAPRCHCPFLRVCLVLWGIFQNSAVGARLELLRRRGASTHSLQELTSPHPPFRSSRLLTHLPGAHFSHIFQELTSHTSGSGIHL